MKTFIKIVSWFFASLLAIVLLLYIFGYGYILKGIGVVYLTGHKTAFIDDYTYFDNHIIKKGNSIQEWPESVDYNTIPATSKLDSLNNELGTVAFLVIKNDSIWYENYAENYSATSRTNSFSMAKSITVSLLGKAIYDGKISGLDEKISTYFPEITSEIGKVPTLGDLASMSSGLDWDEDYYNPFSQTARAYFDDDIPKEILQLKVTEEPGQEFTYLSGNTMLMGMIISKATNQTLSNYLSESFWKPMGMKDDALWQVDSEESGMEKAYCCIASNARDFAKFGKLYKDSGRWNGKQLLSPEFVNLVTDQRFEDAPEYGYGFWISEYKNKDIYYLRGVLGQYVIVIPADNLIIVRLGDDLIRRTEGEKHPKDFFLYIEETYKMLQNAG